MTDDNINNFNIFKNNLLYTKLIHNENSIAKFNGNINFSKNIDYPKLDYGFNHYLHQSNDKKKIFIDNFKDKKKVYDIVNNFDYNIDDYDEDILNFFTNKFSNNLFDLNFFKLWEVLHLFNLFDNKKINISCFCSDSVSPFLSSYLYKKHFFNKMDNTYSIFNIMSNLQSQKGTLFEERKKLIEEYKKKFSKNITNNKFITIDKNIMNLSDINKFIDIVKKKSSNLVFCNYEPYINNYNAKEQDSICIFLSQLIFSFSVLKNEGNMVISIFDTFTNLSSKLLSIIESHFKSVYIYKPFIDKKYENNKYIICKSFIGSSNNIINSLSKIINDINNNKNLNVVDIFSNFQPDEKFINILTNHNIKFSNEKFKYINKSQTYIDNENYRGEDYINYKNIQIKNSKFWIDFFTNNIDKHKDISDYFKTLQ